MLSRQNAPNCTKNEGDCVHRVLAAFASLSRVGGSARAIVISRCFEAVELVRVELAAQHIVFKSRLAAVLTQLTYRLGARR